MIYENIRSGTFISRPNRFIAVADIGGSQEICHVKNTGRCKELLIPEAKVILQEFDSEARKTRYDLTAVYKGDRIVNIDSQAPNKVFAEWAAKYFGKGSVIKAECKYGNSRFDFYIENGERRIFAEIKGVTLEKGGVAMFPDAPTERGLKHVNELCECVKNGYEAYIFFIIQMSGVKYFTPNRETHPQFAEALERAEKHGVRIVCLDCSVSENSLEINHEIKYCLGAFPEKTGG